MKTRIAVLLLGALLAGPAAAETLLVERTKVEPTNAPQRGQTMAQVEATFGAPAQKLEDAGGQKRQWPTIHRWVYPAYTVYFERQRVIDVVVNQASSSETGPKPPIR